MAPVAAFPLDNPPPKRIAGKIQLGELLGRGAFGRVYKGLNFQTGEVVAVKQTRKTDLEPSQLPAIMHELELLQKLSHPHIVKFLGYYEVDDYLFFVMEYVENGSLNETMKKFGVFPEELLVLYIAQVLQGLKYLHDQNVIHRDIKGCNLLLTKEGKIKLADFGSCTNAAVDKQFTVVGTPFWMAPEIISVEGGEKVSDIWSLGCTIIELLTGKPPYWDAGAMSALFKMVACEHPPLPEGISGELKDFLLKCFTRDVNLRPGPDELMKHPWICKNVQPEQEVQTPSAAEIHRTIREYNTKRPNTPASVVINGENGQAVDAKSGRPVRTPKATAEGAHKWEELLARYQKLAEENKELAARVGGLAQDKEELEKKVELQEDEIQHLRLKLASEQQARQRAEKDYDELRKRTKESVTGSSIGGSSSSSSSSKAKNGSASAFATAAPAPMSKRSSAGAREQRSSGGNGSERDHRDTRERERDRERSGSASESASTSRLRAEHHRDHERSSSIGSSALMDSGVLAAVEKKRRPASQTIPSNHLNMINPAASDAAKPPSPSLGVFSATSSSSPSSSASSSPDTTPYVPVAAVPAPNSGGGGGTPPYSTSPSSSSLLSIPPPASSGASSPSVRKKRAPKLCTACTKPIARDGRLAMGKPWHHDCFKCSHCHQVLEEFIERDGRPLCVADFNSLYGNRCGGCGEIIQGQYIQAMNRYWHAGHFRCCVCNSNIQGGFIERDDKPLCGSCFKAGK